MQWSITAGAVSTQSQHSDEWSLASILAACHCAQSFVYRPMCDGRYATRSWLISSSLHGATGQYQRFSFSFNLPTRFSDAVTDYCIWQSATIGLSPLRRLTVTITQTQQITLNSNVSPRLELQSLWSYDLMALYKYVYCYYFLPQVVKISGVKNKKARSWSVVAWQKCVGISMKYLSHLLCENTNSRAADEWWHG